MRFLLTTLVLSLALIACGDDDHVSDVREDVGEDATSDAGADVAEDAEIDTNVEDAGADAVDDVTMDAANDAATDTLRDASVDVQPDTPMDTSVDVGMLSVFQCAENSDCPSGMCNERVPGGVCLGCGSDTDCPGSTECGPFGACAEPCSSDPECGPGRECTRRGCAIARCRENADCGPYRCDDGLCARWPCSATCPTGFSCQNSVCVE